MKTYSKTFISTFAFLVYLLSFSLAYSNKSHQKAVVNIDSVGNSTHQEIIDEFVRVANNELTQIIAKNAINDLNGESQKNNYIFGFEPNKVLINNKYLTQYNQLLADSTSLNNHLVTLNTALKTQGKPLIYIGIDALLGDILSKIKVSGIQTTAKLEQITIQKQDFASFETINNIYKSIYDKVGNNLPDLDSNHPNGMIIIGYGVFKKYTINGEVDPDKLSTDDIKKVSSVQEWQFCNYREKISTLGVGSNAFRALVFQDFSQFPKSTKPDDVQEHLQNFATQVYNSLTGDKVFIPKGRLHKDFYAPDGEYRLKFDTDVTEEQVLKVNALIEEMMDDPLYANYIKPAITAKTQGENKIKQADLISMEKALKDLKEACQNTYSSVTPIFIKQIIEFFRACSNEDPNCQATKGSFIPQCFWNNGYAPYEIAFGSGIIDGAIDFVWAATKLAGASVYTLYKLNEIASCWVEPTYWLGVESLQNKNCKEVREQTKPYFNLTWDIIKLATPPYPGNLSPELLGVFGAISTGTGKAWGIMKSDASTWWNEITETDKCGAYRQGRLVFDVASCFIGIGEISAALKVGSKLAVTGGGLVKYMTSFAAASGKLMAKTVITNAGKTAQFALKKLQNTAVATGLVLQLAGFNVVELGGKKALNQIPNLLTEVNFIQTKLVARGPSAIPYNTIETAVATAENAGGKVVTELKDITLDITENGIDNIVKSFPKGDLKILQIDNLASKGEHFIIKQNNQIVATIKKEIGIGAVTLVGLIVEYIKKPNDTSTEPDECKICTARVPKPSTSLCTKLQKLASLAFTPTTGNIAVNKLCANIANTTVLEAVVDKLLALPTSDASATYFLEDIANAASSIEHICYDANVAQITPSIIEAWKIVYDEKVGDKGKKLNYKTDFKLLKQIDYMRSSANSAMYNTLGGDAVLRVILNKNKVAPCNTCENNKPWFNDMTEYLKDVEYFVKTFGKNSENNTNKSDAVFSSGITSENTGHVFGAIYMLKVLRKTPTLIPNKFEEKLERTGGAGCKPDARLGTKIYEFKSWSPNGNDSDVGSMGDDELIIIGGNSTFLKLANNSYSNTTNSYSQFLCYLSNITNMEDLVYIFDKDMLNAKGQSDGVAYIKLMFQELMKKPNEQQQIFDVIWNNARLRDDLWNPTNFPPNGISKIQAKNIFISWIFDTNSPIYNFITAR